MATYLHPGVYIEEIPSGSKPIEGVSTSITAFVGSSPKGPVGEAVLIQNLDDYKTDFGSIASEEDTMGLAIRSFYLNGGRSAYVCRLAGAGSSSASAEVAGEQTAGVASLIVSAKNDGDWGNAVYFRVLKPDPYSQSFELEIGHQVAGEFVADEVFSGLTMRADDENYVLTQVNDTSLYVELSLGDASDLDAASEEYQDAVIVSGQIPDDGTYFQTNVSLPANLTLNINALGAKLITIAPADLALTGDLADDGPAIATAIEAAVNALGTADYLQDFNCSYNVGSRRFTLTSPESGSEAMLAIYDGDFAETLRLDSSQAAALTGSAVAVTAAHFSAVGTGLPSFTQPMGFTINIDGRGDQALAIDLADITLIADNAVDGEAVAEAIENAVRAVDTSILAYKDFTCVYSAAREFILTSGDSSAPSSSLTISFDEAAVATRLGLTAGTLVGGRTVNQGAREVVPLETLGLLDQGQALAGGVLTAPTAADYADFFGTVLRKVRDASIIVIPGESWDLEGTGFPILSTALAHCESMKNRVLIVDPPQGLELDQANTVDELSLPKSTYSTLYYPWVSVSNPFYNVDTNPNAAKTISIAPSAIAAGMWAKIDGKRGVWKAPAGVETQLIGVSGLDENVGDGEQDQLNPLGVNCIRNLPSYGSVFWGARTLATKADPEWRYVPVRRTAIFIEQSIYNGIQWAVFEGNDTPLWGSLRANIGGFMNGLFRAGAFQGATANDAYFVRCGLGDTMTQADIDRGQVIVVVGFAPLKPAEFVIVRIQQKVSQQ
ncbi:MAG: phage tail sheath family protein [Akkermansiaceae bacterium]